MLIYYAGPLFCEAELRFNAQLVERLEEMDWSVYLPQRDGFELASAAALEMTPAERQRAIFHRDRANILAADVFLIVLDGRVPDEGACAELGLAYGQKFLGGRNKLLIGLRTDVRRGYPDGKLNAMLRGCLDILVESEEDLLATLAAPDLNGA